MRAAARARLEASREGASTIGRDCPATSHRAIAGAETYVGLLPQQLSGTYQSLALSVRCHSQA